MTRRKTEADYQALAIERGIEWLDRCAPQNVAVKTRWRCANGHEWEAVYSVAKNNNCPHCAGNFPKKESDYHALALERGMNWIGTSLPPNVHVKTLWQCPYGHTWEATYGNIKCGKGCPHCAGKARRSAADYYLLAAMRGFEWTGSQFPKTTGVKTHWRCPQGHEWEASYLHVQQGTGCPHCAGTIPKIQADYHALAADIGFEWIGSEVPPNVRTNTLWRCSKGHEWEAVYSSLKAGSRCPRCAVNFRKTNEDYHALANLRRLTWVGDSRPRDTTTKTTWYCREGHEWIASYGQVHANEGCPYCLKRVPKTAEDYHVIAAKRGFEWLGESVPSRTDVKTRWRCPNGHEWDATYGKISSDRGCPLCDHRINGARVSKAQLVLNEMLGGEVNFPVGRFRIDIALLNPIPIAVEYDSWYWHKNRMSQDERRDKVLHNNGWRILHIRTNALIPTMDELNTALQRLIDGEIWVEIVLSDWGGT